MRKIAVFGTLLACAACTIWAQSGKTEKSETLLRWHFAGTRQVANVKDLKTFREVFELPETTALREAAAQHFAAQAAGRFTKGGNTNANPEIIRVIQPLLPDLWLNESSFHLSAKGAEDTDWILALKLDANRAEEWSRALSQLAKEAGMQGGQGGSSWSAQKENYRLSFSRAKEWTVIEGGFGTSDAKIGKDFRSDLGKRRGKQLLTAEVNSPLLGKVWNSEHLAHAPRMTVRAEPKGDGIRSELVMDYPQDLGIKAEKWDVPTSLITEPLVGFTAIQGVERKLGSMEEFKALGAQETPNQVFLWVQGNSPFSIFFAGDVKNPGQVVTNASLAFKDIKLPTGTLRLSTNRPALFWDGLPAMIKPFLEVASAPNSSFVRAGMFPVQVLTNNPAPAELFEQLRKRNLIYYEWEISGARMRLVGHLWQLYHLLGGKPTQIDAPSTKWLKAIEGRMANTVTEGTLDNSRRIKLVRQSQLGFNSVELVLLAHLLDDKDIVEIRRRAGQSEGQSRPNVPPPAPSLP
jgi:hypothetical protein